ncbi:MAG: lamin tail domain-containing protein [Actinobacteria bacterium]|nr:lamin tail domain-containing protein [Actinomycetota bacterium]
MRVRRGSLVLPLVVGVSLAAVAAIATAASDADSRIDACQNARHGLVRIVGGSETCKRNETAVSWNRQGPAGPAGPIGPPGPQGPVGPQGPAGPAGVGTVADLQGTACTTFDGAAGRVQVAVGATDLIMLTCEAGTSPPPPPPSGASRLVINEVDYDQVGTDADGFVEIANTGTEPASLDGIALVLVNGGDSTEYARRALSGTLAPGGYLAVDVDLQNGPDGVALVDVAGSRLLDALSYEGAIRAAAIGTSTFDLVEGTALPDAVADSNAVGGSLARIPDGRDTNDAAADWAFTTTVTRGAPNVMTAA